MSYDWKDDLFEKSGYLDSWQAKIESFIQSDDYNGLDELHKILLGDIWERVDELTTAIDIQRRILWLEEKTEEK